MAASDAHVVLAPLDAADTSLDVHHHGAAQRDTILVPDGEDERHHYQPGWDSASVSHPAHGC